MSDQKVKLKRRAKITVRWEVVTKLVMVDLQVGVMVKLVIKLMVKGKDNGEVGGGGGDCEG